MFRNRREAGQRLAKELTTFDLTNPLVLAIPRGGIVPASVIADELHAELDVVLAHKLRSPGQPELALGAIGEDGVVYLNCNARNLTGVTNYFLERERQLQTRELERRSELFRSGRRAAKIQGRSVILTDDGIATGSTMLAAIEVIRAQQPHELIAAIPVAPPSVLPVIRELCDRIICLESPESFMAVGQFYESFLAVDDEQVIRFLRSHAPTFHG